MIGLDSVVRRPSGEMLGKVRSGLLFGCNGVSLTRRQLLPICGSGMIVKEVNGKEADTSRDTPAREKVELGYLVHRLFSIFRILGITL